MAGTGTTAFRPVSRQRLPASSNQACSVSAAAGRCGIGCSAQRLSRTLTARQCMNFWSGCAARWGSTSSSRGKPNQLQGKPSSKVRSIRCRRTRCATALRRLTFIRGLMEELSISATTSRCLHCGLLVAMLLVSTVTPADEGRAVSYAGRQVSSVIDQFRDAGIDIAYSTNLVTEDLYVAFEPEPGTPLEIMNQILHPHGLTVREEVGVYLIVREELQTTQSAEPAEARQAADPDIETVVVAASRYEISRDISA